jgi:hypothetical protein
MTKQAPDKMYMVVEHLKDAAAIYHRLWDRGRMLPKGLVLVSVWFDENVERSYRLMRTHNRRLLDKWMANWSDLIDFEAYPVITPEAAGEKVAVRGITAQRARNASVTRSAKTRERTLTGTTGPS